jgi:hypothetical protein
VFLEFFMNKFVTCNLFLAPSLSSWTAPVSFGQEQSTVKLMQEQSTVKLIKAGGLGGLQGRLQPFAVDFDRNQLLRVAEDRGMMAGSPPLRARRPASSSRQAPAVSCGFAE